MPKSVREQLKESLKKRVFAAGIKKGKEEAFSGGEELLKAAIKRALENLREQEWNRAIVTLEAALKGEEWPRPGGRTKGSFNYPDTGE